MEYPLSDNSSNISKSFLENERGDNCENVSNKKIESNDFTLEESVSNKVTGNEDDTFKTTNVSDNVVEQNNFDKNKKIAKTDDINNQDKSEDDKFKVSSSKISKETSSSEEEKFKDNKNEDEEVGKDFVTNEVNEVKEEKKSDPTDESKISDDKKDEWMDIFGNGQLKKKVIKAGEIDSRPQNGNLCDISIIGKLEDGTIFEENQCLQINVGDSEVVQGLDFALNLMDKGEKAEIIVAPRFGYGSLGNNNIVPPDATLYYEITLLDVKPEPLISSLTIEERIAIGRRKKERGNWLYTREEHTLAINSYRRALEYLDDTDIPGECSDDQVHQLLEERLKTYNNLGVSQIKISSFDAALLSIDQVLNCQPKNVKALFRKSKILKEKGEIGKSIEVIRQVLSIEPDTKAFQQELAILLAAQRKDNTKQRDLYKKMMGNSSQDNDNEKKKKGPQNALRWIAAVSVAVAILGAVAFKYRL